MAMKPSRSWLISAVIMLGVFVDAARRDERKFASSMLSTSTPDIGVVPG